MEELKQLVEDFVDYTRTWSISEDEWFSNIECNYKDRISDDLFERAIREEILYCFIYKIQSIKYQLENDLNNYYNDETDFHNASIEIEKKIQKLFKDFKIERE